MLNRRDLLKIGAVTPIIPYIPSKDRKVEIAYKVVTNDLKSWLCWSTIVRKDIGKYAIDYKIGQWIYPKIGKIFVITEREKALTSPFLINHYGCRLFRVECINLSNTIQYNPGIVNDNSIERFWSKELQYYDTEHDFIGLCDGIKLLEELI